MLRRMHEPNGGKSMDNSFLSNLLLIIVAFIVVMIVVAVVAVYLVIRQLRRFTSPDIAQMRQKLEELRIANPGASRESLIRKIIQQQAMKCGVVGAITGLGGFITLPVALPVDILVSMRIQATMVQFIALMYEGEASASADNLKLQTYLVMSGGVEVTETTFNVVMRFVLRIIGESLSILVPVIGLVVGFAVNYVIAQATGNIAMRWYATRTQTGAYLAGGPS
jgi:hypothetical protein